jgi:AraC-like DNA-binding protein
LRENKQRLSGETLDRLLFEIRNEPAPGGETEFLQQKKAELLRLSAVRLSPEPVNPGSKNKYSSDYTQIEQTARILRDRLHENPDLNTLARIACMSPSKLKYTFKAITGYSIGQYRRRLRLEKSLQLLADPHLSFAEIARQIGYRKPGSFSIFFEKATGMRPAEYRSYITSHTSEKADPPLF